MNYWLFKSEPESYSWADLEKERHQTTYWNGVRNYQARNFLRDQIQVGDQVFFYHSNNRERAIVGLAKVVRAGYPDHTAWEPGHQYFDSDSQPESPTWYMVDIKQVRPFARALTLDELKAETRLAGLELLRRGSMLSIQPVSVAHAKVILELAERPVPEQTKPQRPARPSRKTTITAPAKKSTPAKKPTVKTAPRRKSTS
ncbi:MAG: EVE domain-containing protein [Pirellulales bacterium]|nr:EVE domain-containing protein [Pirellulales bacterium]